MLAQTSGTAAAIYQAYLFAVFVVWGVWLLTKSPNRTQLKSSLIYMIFAIVVGGITMHYIYETMFLKTQD